MGKRDSGPGVVHIDERFLMEWFENGYQSLVRFLARQAAFADWCDAHPKEVE